MVEPVVSVVMSVYNGEHFLREAVESILDQSFLDFEFIIVDDGSTDCSASILDSYKKTDPRIRIYQQENSGLIESLNRGCKLSRGKYIARMDADDIAIRTRLMRQVDFMEKHPEVGVVGGAVELINPIGKFIGSSAKPIEDREIRSALLRGECPLTHPTVLIQKDILVSVGGYRKLLVDAEDYDLWLRIAERSQLANLKAVVLKYRRHPRQVSVRMFRQQALSNLVARMSALSRRDGIRDPLDSIVEITPAVLAELGVSETRQQAVVAQGYLNCIRSMIDAGEYSIASNVVSEMLRSIDWKHAKKNVIADFRLLVARLYWCQRRYVRSLLTAGHAVITRPIILARPLKPVLRRSSSV